MTTVADLTPETLAAWREDAEQFRNVNYRGEAVVDARILALLDALDASEADLLGERAMSDHHRREAERISEYAQQIEAERVPFVRGYRRHDDGSMSPIERWVKRADGRWMSLDSDRATYSDIQMVVD